MNARYEAPGNQIVNTIEVSDVLSHDLIPAASIGAGYFADLILLEITNANNTATVLTISDGTKSYKYAIAPAGGAIIPMKEYVKYGSNSNTAWTAQQSLLGDLYINVQALKVQR